MEQHFVYSSYREKTIEHIFAGELLRRLWQRGIYKVEILKAEVDACGYDLVIEANRILRHIQLKASYNGSRTRRQIMNAKLATKPSGCMIWIGFDPDTLDLGPFRFFGAGPGAPLPDISRFPMARHTKANAAGEKLQRANSHIAAIGDFEVLDNFDRLIDRLFLARSAPSMASSLPNQGS